MTFSIDYLNFFQNQYTKVLANLKMWLENKETNVVMLNLDEHSDHRVLSFYSMLEMTFTLHDINIKRFFFVLTTILLFITI